MTLAAEYTLNLPPPCPTNRDQLSGEKECARIGFREKAIGELRSCYKGVNYTYMQDFLGDEVIWNGFLVKGFKYPSNFKAILHSGFELDGPSFHQLVDSFRGNGALYRAFHTMLAQGQSKTLHDFKPLINALTRVVERSEIEFASDATAPTLQQTRALQTLAREVFSILGAIKNQIFLSDYIVAPELLATADKQSMEIYGLFRKSCYIYGVLAEARDRYIDMPPQNPPIRIERKLNKAFQLVPAILLDNAIKYSLRHSTIRVSVFTRADDKFGITVESYGPTVPAEMRDKIWDLGRQYIHDNDTSKGGGGFGLFLARTICNFSGCKITYQATYDKILDKIPVGSNFFIVEEL